MKKQALFMVVLLAAVSLLAAVVASNAFANGGGYAIPCGLCHGTEGPAPVVTLVSNNGTMATYDVSAPNAHEWAVFAGQTRVGGTVVGSVPPTTTSGSFTVPVGVTYTVYAEYEEPPGAAHGGQVDVTPTGVTYYTITPTAGANGAISPNTPQSVASGGNVTFTMTPAEGYVVDDVLVNGVSVGAVTTYEITNVTAAGTIAASFKLAPLVTYTIAAGAGENGTISPVGDQTVSEGDDITFAITPAANYYVETLTVDGVLVQPTKSYTFTDVRANHTISATFAASPLFCTITASVDGTGGTLVPGAPIWTLPRGAGITYYLVPDAGYHVDTVLVNGWPVAWDQDDDSYTFSGVDQNQTLSVKYAVTMRTLTASATGSGTIAPTGAQEVAEGSDVTYTFTPNAGNVIGSVTVDGVYVGMPESYTFSDITEDHTIAVRFVAQAVNYTVTPSVVGATGGLITPNFPFTVTSGGSVTFYFLPTAGYEVGTVSVDGTAVAADDDDSYTLANVTANHTISVAFVPVTTFTITPSCGTHGSISPDTAQTVVSGDSISCTITPDAGYHVDDVLVDGVSVGDVTSYEFSDVTANHTISASFAWTKVASSTTLKASAKTIKRNGYVTLTATLKGSAGFTNATIRFEVKKAGTSSYRLLKAVKVNSKGVATYKYKVTAKGTRYHRVKFAGNATYLPAPLKSGLKLVVK